MADKHDSKTDIRDDSNKAAILDFEMNTMKEIESYTQNEISRYEAFADVRGTDLFTYGSADAVLTQAESTYGRAESRGRYEGKSKVQAKRYAENEANKVIDEFISNHNPDYVPPEPIDKNM